MEALVKRELYGGAIELHIPARFVDISDFRPVPDHQEVWADAREDQSLVVEVVERLEAGNAECGRVAWQDAAEAAESSHSELQGVQQLGPGDVPHLLPSGVCAYACVAHGVQTVSKGRQGADAANRVEVRMAVLRLPRAHSELLLTLNSPLSISPASQSAQHAGAGERRAYQASGPLLQAMLQTLQVHDW
eukprot:CAMPEP_0202864604 /NCGR_PEP_ID=MMETSP1391-20130828/4776_1 /ASSEMBLY_ACC=CAM_ASM_000867 /TAXON_ID=1034604 /ORGANISM="Chlamydomonas leiostraca, Strain SAG 11-49" /LENGTH=189 /DNA_ID=CAMNT_0049544361 /DNA_START=94 /DNA_END=660 /DNA_ORIENTATION=-